MPVFLLRFLPFLGVVPAWAWKLVSVGLVLLVVFFYGYNKGKGVERERCEERARIAQQAANTQDDTANTEVRQQEKEVTEALTQQKKVDDARIAELEKQLKARPTRAECLYDKSNADPDNPR